MRNKDLRVIGRGDLINHFLKSIYDYSSNRTSADDFFAEIGSIVFLNNFYGTNEKFFDTMNSETLDSLEKIRKKYGVDVSAERMFGDFFGDADILVDAYGSARPENLHICVKNVLSENELERGLQRTYKERKYKEDNLCWLLDVDKSAHRKDKIKELLDSDYDGYEEDFNNKNKDQNFLNKDQFTSEWFFILESMRKTKKLFDEKYKRRTGIAAYPSRLMLRVPFQAREMIRRGKSIANLGNNKPFPTYFNMVNEPCTMSNILSGIVPELTPYLVASMGYDQIRLENELNEKYGLLKKKAGLEDFRIKIRMAGIHDNDMMAALVDPQTDADRKALSKIFEASDNRINIKDMQEYLTQRVDKYHENYNLKTGKAKKIDTRKEISECLVSSIINSCKSKGRELSLFPNPTERPLYDGIFRPGINGGGFTLLPYRFRNQRAVSQ